MASNLQLAAQTTPSSHTPARTAPIRCAKRYPGSQTMHGGLRYSQLPSSVCQLGASPLGARSFWTKSATEISQPAEPSPQRADVLSERFGQHIDAPLHQVHSGGSAEAVRQSWAWVGEWVQGGWVGALACAPLVAARREALARCRTPRMLPATPMHDHCTSWPGCKRAYTVHAQCMHSASQRRFSGAQPPCPPYRCEASSSIAVAGCTKWVTSAMCTCRHEAASEEQPCQPGATGKGASPCPTATTSSRGPQQAKRARGWPTAHTQATRGSRPALPAVGQAPDVQHASTRF